MFVGKLEVNLTPANVIHVDGGTVTPDTIRAARKELMRYHLQGIKPKAYIFDGHPIIKLAKLVGLKYRRQVIVRGYQVGLYQ